MSGMAWPAGALAGCAGAWSEDEDVLMGARVDRQEARLLTLVSHADMGPG